MCEMEDKMWWFELANEMSLQLACVRESLLVQLKDLEDNHVRVSRLSDISSQGTKYTKTNTKS